MDELDKVLEEPSFENLVALVESKKHSQDHSSALEQLEGIFVKILLVHVENQAESSDVFACFETALQYYPENCEILNELANYLVINPDSMDHIDIIFKVLKLHLPSSVWRRHLKFIAIQVHFVNLGFKTGFLIDIGPRLETKSWLAILDNLSYSNLILLEFNDNICILNRDTYLRAPKPCFIDVSGETPVILPASDERMAGLTLSVHDNIVSNNFDKFVKFEIAPELTPTLFGLLIGYPVVYSFEKDYNLAHQDLQIVEAKSSEFVVASFSYPIALTKNLSEVIGKWKTKVVAYNLRLNEYVKNLDVAVLLERLLEAALYFEKVLSIDPTFLKSYQNLQNLKNQIVEGWHFRMLNDETRNSAYKRAIKSKVDENYDTVLDIGTGTGLLSIYTRMAGAKKITACERSEVMVQIADTVLKNNHCEDVVLVPKYSTDIVCGKDVHEKFNLIVTEILDSGVFGEGVLQTLIHAKEKLLAPNGVILPNSVKIYIAGFQSETIASQNVVTNSSFQDFIFLDGFNLCSKNDDHYDSLEIRLLTDFKFITTIGMAMEISFNDLGQMRAHLKGKSGPLVKLACECEGHIDGFLVWFRLHLCDDIYLETAPQVQNCWNQAIIRVRSRHLVNKHQTINLSMTAMSGILKVSHNLDNHISRVYEIDNHIIRYINDSGYLIAQENAILQKLKKRNRKSFEHVLDFSPFPYTGLILLKEHRAKHLYVSNDNEAFIKFLAQKNCIPESCIRFLKTPLDHFVDDASLLMDLIILAPFETVGTLRADQISVYPTLLSKLKPNGIIVPIKIELYGVLISSDWLVKMSRVNNAEMVDMKIADLVNKYQIENSIDIGEFEYTTLTQTFKISDVDLDDQLHETSLSVEVTNRDKFIDGILCTYKIQFVANCDSLSSYRKFSHIQRTAFLSQRGDSAGGQSHIKVHFVQNHGIIKCYLSS